MKWSEKEKKEKIEGGIVNQETIEWMDGKEWRTSRRFPIEKVRAGDEECLLHWRKGRLTWVSFVHHHLSSLFGITHPSSLSTRRAKFSSSKKAGEKECQEVTHRWPILSWAIVTLSYTHICILLLTIPSILIFSGTPFNTFPPFSVILPRTSAFNTCYCWGMGGIEEKSRADRTSHELIQIQRYVVKEKDGGCGWWVEENDLMQFVGTFIQERGRRRRR